MQKCGSLAVPSRQLSSVTPKWSSIASERSHPGLNDTAVAWNSASSLGQRQCHPVRRDLRQVVEERAAVVGVELGVAVGDLDHETAGFLDEQRDGGVARDDVGVDGQAQDAQASVEIVLPQLGVPAGEVIAAPDVVDEDVEASLLGLDARHQPLHLRRVEVVADDGDGRPSGLGGPSGRLFDRLGPIDLRSTVLAAAPGGVDERPGGGQLDREGAAGTRVAPATSATFPASG